MLALIGLQSFSRFGLAAGNTDVHPFWVVTDEPDLDRAARGTVDENGMILYYENVESGLNGFWVQAKDLRETNK